MFRKIFGFLLIGLAFCTLVGAAASFAQARHQRHQAQKMHALAVEHRAYKPEAIWRHDERIYANAARSDEATTLEYLIVTAILGTGALVILIGFKQRRYRDYRPSSSSTYSSHSNSTWNSGASNSCTAPVFLQEPIPTRDYVPPMRRTAREIRDEFGKLGEDQLVASLKPLLDVGWRIEKRNLGVETEAGGKYGDIDVLLISPNRLGFSIDAKNGTQRVWYDGKTEEIVFDKGWTSKYGKAAPPRRYAVANAEYLAAWAERTFHLRKVFPIMAFTDNHDLRLEKRVRNFHIVRVGNIVDRLRAIDSRFGKSSSIEDRHEPRQDAAVQLVSERSDDGLQRSPTDYN